MSEFELLQTLVQTTRRAVALLLITCLDTSFCVAYIVRYTVRSLLTYGVELTQITVSVPLDGLGSLRAGYVARLALTDCSGLSPLRALQLRDVAADGSIVWSTLRCAQGVTEPERYQVRTGDLLIPLRATRIAALVPAQVPDGIIAVGHWGILTPDPTGADAGYLAWYLNHPGTAARLQGVMSGTSLPFLSMSALRAFEVELVPIERQRRIARAAALNARATELEQHLAIARRDLFNHLTLSTIRRKD